MTFLFYVPLAFGFGFGWTMKPDCVGSFQPDVNPGLMTTTPNVNPKSLPNKE